MIAGAPPPEPQGPGPEARPRALGAGDQTAALLRLLQLEADVRRIETLRELVFHLANESRSVLPYRQACVLRRGRDWRLEAVSSEQLTEMALRNRPEMRGIAYRLRINEVDEDAAALELLPSIRGYLGLNHDSNDFLVNDNWTGWGARVSWDLMNIARLPRRKAVLQGQEALPDARALALTQAIATQVHVSNKRFHSLQREVRAARENHRISDQIFAQTRDEFDSGMGSERELVTENLNAILAALRFDATYAEMQGVFANVHASVGLDAFDGTMTGNEGVDELAASLRALWRARGDQG